MTEAQVPEVNTPSDMTDSVSSPDTDDTPVEINDTITETMVLEEEKLHKLTNIKVEKEKQKVLEDKAKVEFSATVDQQRFKRLNFLIEKSTLYANFLAQKLEKQKMEALAKATAEDARRELEQAKNSVKTESSVEVTAPSTRAGTRGQSKPVVAPKKKEKVDNSAKKRKADEAEYSIADYVDADTLKKQKKTDDQPVAPIKPSAPITKASISARQPSLVTGGILRDYQLAGVEWMVSLYENGLNGILADEMGLGKTLQTISFLAYLREKGVWGPFLVVAPLSTLANWVNEFERFTPTVPVVLYHGTQDQRTHIRNKRFRKLDPSFPVVVTSYEIVMNDRKYLQKYQWKYIVVDEGHRLKNMNCKLIRELKTYHSANRLLLTGTPLQNNLSELWSLLNFLLPEIFDDPKSFEEWFDFSDINDKEGQERILGQESQSGIVSSLHHILKPFLLRRVKTDVEHSLPKKREYLLYAPLTPVQKEWYDAVLGLDIRNFLIQKKAGLDSLEEEVAQVPDDAASEVESGDVLDLDDVADAEVEEEKELTVTQRRQKRTKTTVSYQEKSDSQYFKEMEAPRSIAETIQKTLAQTAREIDIKRATKAVTNMKLLNVVMQLRKVCNHPFLFDWPLDPATRMPVLTEDLLNSSGKMLVLNRLLPTLFERGHKVLIFSQFTTMLDIIQDWAETYKKWQCCRIDGSVAQEDRRQQIAAFNTTPDLKLFLLSTRSGGLGINLTSSDTVIIFDSDWNPQMDLQAQDRVHRIGQTKPVVIYRLVTANTVEAKILQKAAMKRKLEKLVIHKGKFKQAPSTVSGNERKLAVSDLAEMLAQDDGEKFQVATKDDVVISDKHLEILLDRSEAAYEGKTLSLAENEEGVAAFETVKDVEDDQNDVLKAGKMAAVE